MARAPLVHLCLFLACALPVFAQGGSPDPIFAGIPFERWLEDAEPPQIPWKVEVTAHDLSRHQRLRASVRIQVDGKELVKRRGKSELVMLVQFNDAQGQAYQIHNKYDLNEVQDELRNADLVYTQEAWVLPGEYRVSMALLDSSSGEHSATRRTLRVPGLRNDPLPKMWRDLPPVEFLTAEDVADRWFLPSITGRLHLPVAARRPVHINVLANVSLSELAANTPAAYSMSMGSLIPALKVLSQIEVQNGSLDLALLDVSRRRITFEQKEARDVDWPELRKGLKDADPNVIDVESLKNRKSNLEFLATEVSRRIEAAPRSQPQVFIVLSGPMAFVEGDSSRTVQPGRHGNARVFYIRLHPWLSLGPRARRGGPGMIPRAMPHWGFDSLVRTLDGFKPRVFEITTPMEFRKALATMIEEIARL